MTTAEFDAWRTQAIPAYAADKVASGQWTADAALERSAQEHTELLPQGLDTPDNHLFTVVGAQEAAVGCLWFAVKTRFGSRIAFLFNIEIWPAHQRQGHATRAFVALESKVRELELSGIALHVFGHNHAARALYAKLGYEPTNISLFKRVGG